MYKKKLGVRVVTAITVGSLLCSNASVAMAAEEVSSIIKEHTADEETTEAPEEEVTETEEVVEETTEEETEEVVEETTEAETEEVVEETTEAETEEVVEETTEVEADEEELENDFEEVELEAVETPAVAETSERLLADVAAATDIIYVSYIDENGVPVDGAEIEQVNVPAGASSFNSSLLKKVPAGYELCVTGDIALESDTINVEVRKKADAKEKTVYVSYIDEETQMPLENAIEEITVAANATSFNTSDLKEVPDGYEVCVKGDVTFTGDSVNVEVRKKAEAAEKTVYVATLTKKQRCRSKTESKRSK